MIDDDEIDIIICNYDYFFMVCFDKHGELFRFIFKNLMIRFVYGLLQDFIMMRMVGRCSVGYDHCIIK